MKNDYALELLTGTVITPRPVSKSRLTHATISKVLTGLLDAAKILEDMETIIRREGAAVSLLYDDSAMTLINANIPSTPTLNQSINMPLATESILAVGAEALAYISEQISSINDVYQRIKYDMPVYDRVMPIKLENDRIKWWPDKYIVSTYIEKMRIVETMNCFKCGELVASNRINDHISHPKCLIAVKAKEASSAGLIRMPSQRLFGQYDAPSIELEDVVAIKKSGVRCSFVPEFYSIYAEPWVLQAIKTYKSGNYSSMSLEDFIRSLMP